MYMNDIGLARNMDNDEKAFPKTLEEVKIGRAHV